MNGNNSPTVPVWLLDVDGVLNAFSKPGWHAQPTRRYAHVGGLEFKIRWAPSLIDALRDLIASNAVEVRWATSWVAHIDQITRIMSLPPLPLAFELPPDVSPATDAMHDAALAAKRTAALDVVASGRRLLWTDDDAIWADGPERDVLDAAGSLLIAPDDRRGLQPDDIDAIRVWLARG